MHFFACCQAACIGSKLPKHTRRAEACECAVQKYEPPSGDLAEQIEKDFGSLDKLVAGFNPKTAAIQVCFTLPPHGAVCPTRSVTIQACDSSPDGDLGLQHFLMGSATDFVHRCSAVNHRFLSRHACLCQNLLM